jgi:hypothetical protein
MLLIGYRVGTCAIKFFCKGTAAIIKYIFWRNSNVKRMNIFHTNFYTCVILFHESMHAAKKSYNTFISSSREMRFVVSAGNPYLTDVQLPLIQKIRVGFHFF